MDLFILFTALITFIVFFVLHIIILRLLGSSKILKGMSYSIFASSVFHIILFYRFFEPIYFSVSYIIFILMALIFIWGFLGVVTTSLRVQLLTEINKSGDNGISYKKLLEKYNKDIIIQNRLVRLTVSGEIRKEGDYYFYNK